MVLNYRKVRDKMQVELKVNDKSVRVEMTEEQLKELGLIEEQRTGYERVKKGEMYYLVDIYNNIMTKVISKVIAQETITATR